MRRLVFAAAVLSACTGLKSAVETTPPPVPDGGATSDDDDDDDTIDGDAGDVTPPDAGEPPADFECDKDEWTKPTKTRSECNPREVRLVEETSTILTTGIAIAVTPAGRVGISYNTEESQEQGRFHLAHFTPKTSGFTKPEVIERPALPYFHDGMRSRLAATAPDTLHVLTYDVDDVDLVGKLRSTTLVDGKKPLTEPEVVGDSISGDSRISFAVAPDGTAYAMARVAIDATKAKLTAAKREPGGAWTPLADVPEMGLGLLPREAPGIGASALHVDPAGKLHLLFHYNDGIQVSTPRYHTYAATKWTFRKTVDNPATDGVTGYDPHLATFGNRRYALYFYRKAIQDPPQKADLRLATWTGEDRAQIEIVDQGIAAPEQDHPRYAAAMAIDKYGLVHLAIVRPTAANRAYLEYRRQQRIPGGGTKWLSDVVAPEVLGESADAHVALTVDDDARPHIAYRSGADSRVYYATRFDR
ncbi:MAG: hypothetical protein KIT84_03675 [Labilithrix sp.]|nr:hypothetical protein [Labilithrix sp.]MCW5810083.1 hypothetical protein [Labilithrix sp.]